MTPRRRSRPLPPVEEILGFVEARGGRATTREIARAFGITGKDRVALRRLLTQLRRQGRLHRAPRRRRGAPRAEVPPVAMVEITGVDEDGELYGESPVLPGATVRVLVEELEPPAPGEGDRVLARLLPTPDGEYEAHVLKRIPRAAQEVVGVVEPAPWGLLLRPAGRRDDREYRILEGRVAVEPGDLVRARLRHLRPLAVPEAVVVERFGRADEPQAISPAVAAQYGLSLEFPRPVLARAETLAAARRRGREDLTDLPLVTIDGEDARDFDDAVWAERDPDRAGDYRLWVAIADVAWYVRGGDPLDEEARRRGNSVYFPDRAIPMLPEALSTDLCSLKPEVERACIAVEMRVDRRGRLTHWRFHRGIMRSRARLTYNQVQAAREGRFDGTTERLWEPVLAPLFEVFERLRRARVRRGSLDLELPEQKVVFDAAGRAVDVVRRPQLESNRLIEECMIAANVAVATALTEAKAPILYRVHDRPDPEKLEVLADYLERIGVPWSRTAKKPADFTRLLERLRGSDLYETVATFVLRAQAQAVYQPHNIGHFGLNLRCYCHFTSPIRRYADLQVHRALIRTFALGAGGERRGSDPAVLEELGRHLSRTERRAMEAEREALQRFVSLVMKERVGARFVGRITGVQHFGLFVALEESGAEGFVPVSQLGEDIFNYDGRHHALVGRRHGETYGLGDRVEVTLLDADPVRGTLTFRIESQTRAQGAALARAAWERTGPPRRTAGRRRRLGRS